MLLPTLLETNLPLLLLTFCLCVWCEKLRLATRFSRSLSVEKGIPLPTVAFRPHFCWILPNFPLFFKAEIRKRGGYSTPLDFLSSRRIWVLSNRSHAFNCTQGSQSHCYFVTEQKCIKPAQVKTARSSSRLLRGTDSYMWGKLLGFALSCETCVRGEVKRKWNNNNKRQKVALSV